jgi:hypothetical protein
MISDNNHIIYSAEDIQRYWNGQLSPQEMHAMEKAALDDPFLADAMEGMGMAMQEHEEKMLNTQLSEMRVQVQARSSELAQTAPVRSFRWWQVAAAAFVLVVAGYWFLSSGRSDNDGLVAKQRSTPGPELHGSSTPNAVAADSDLAVIAPAKRADSIEMTAGITSKPAIEPGYYEFNTPSEKGKKYLSIDTITYRPPAIPPLAFSRTEPEAKTKENISLARNAPVANKNLDSVSNVETEVVTLQETFANAQKADDKIKDKEPKLQNVVSGIVTDNRNNPLPNVYIRLDNRNSYTTDPAGNFKIPVSDSVVKVSVSLQGYATQNFQLRSTFNGAGSVAENQLRLQTNEEMAANGRLASHAYFDKKSAKGKYDNEGVIRAKITEQDAQPVYGWLTYEQYLEKNKRVPASNPNLIGDVAISFEINKKGERSDYKVEKSLSADHDAEALRLVREGPSWKLNKGRKSRVTVIVRF